jgi:PKHD-type hydroxylase
MRNSYVIPTLESNPQEYYWFEHGFSKEQLERLARDLESIAFQNATTIGSDKESVEAAEAIRKSKVKWLPQDSRFEWLYDLMLPLAKEANDNLWNFNLYTMLEQIQYTEYWADENGHYTWHQDIGPGNASKRKVSITIQLSDPSEYDGGELEIWWGGTSIRSCPKGAGVAVLFPSYMMHRVTPVTRGVRKSLVLWIGGEHYK